MNISPNMESILTQEEQNYTRASLEETKDAILCRLDIVDVVRKL